MNMSQGRMKPAMRLLLSATMTTLAIGFVKTAGVKGGVKTDILGLNTKIAASEKQDTIFIPLKEIFNLLPQHLHTPLREKQMLTLL